MKNLIGLKNNRLKVIEELAEKQINGKLLHKVKVRCECGSIKIIRRNSWLCGHTKSCGCLQKEKLKITQKNKRKADSRFNDIVRDYRNGAVRLNRKFELTEDELKILFKGNCSYCGSVPSSVKKRKGLHGEFIYNGIDRVDNLKGYSIDNVVSCCWKCNKMKQSLTKNEFLEQIKKIYEFTSLNI